MKKYALIGLVFIATIAAIRVAYPYFINWYLSEAFEPVMKKGGGFQRLADVLEASIGGTLARGDVQLQPGGAAGEGALSYYQKNPQALERDKKYFKTWHSALTIADASRKPEHQMGRWESSATAAWLAPSHRTDAWGHAFCIRSDQQWTIVLSPGPQALSSLDCSTLKVPDEDLARIPQRRLNPLASGALILVVKR